MCVFGCLLQFYKRFFAIENVKLFLVRLCGNVFLFLPLPQESRLRKEGLKLLTISWIEGARNVCST